MKIPNYAAREVFTKLIKSAEQVKGGSTFLFRGKCPLCNDHKKRMYLKEYPSHHLVYCHNCGYSHQLQVFIKENFPDELSFLRSFILDSIRTGVAFKDEKFKKEKTQTDEYRDSILTTYMDNVAFSIMNEQKIECLETYRQKCISYVTDRRIPKDVYKDFFCVTKGVLAGYIGIPFFNETKDKLLHIQGRLVIANKNAKQQKYLFLKDAENGVEIENKEIWGSWRVNAATDEVVICEGTLDAAAFETGIATCGATISDSFINSLRLKYKSRIWCVDNYWHDEAGRDLTNRLLAMGERCFIIPKSIVDCKDANDLIVKIFKEQSYIPKNFIKENIYYDKIGKIKLNLLKG
jgi:hypothetical protein